MKGQLTTSSNNNNVATTQPFEKPFWQCHDVIFSLSPFCEISVFRSLEILELASESKAIVQNVFHVDLRFKD